MRKRKKASKRTRVQAEDLLIQQRIDEVLGLRLDGAEFHDLREYARQKEWGLSDGHLRRYQAAADDAILEEWHDDRPQLIARHLLQRRRLYAQAIEVGDLRTALAVAKDEADLGGLYPAKEQKHEHTGANGAPIEHKHDFESLRKLPADELARLYRAAIGTPDQAPTRALEPAARNGSLFP